MSDQLELLEKLIPQIAQARTQELFGEALQDAWKYSQELVPGVERLERWNKSVHLLKTHWEVEEKVETIEALRNLQSAGEKMAAAQDSNQLAAVRSIATVAKSRVETVLRDGSRAWQRRIHADTGSLQSLGALLSEFADTRDLGRRMACVAARGSELALQFPPTEEQVQAHGKLLEDAIAIRQGLAEIGAGASVEAFLIALANEEATLDMADDAVLEWIRKRKSDRRFRISLNRVGTR